MIQKQNIKICITEVLHSRNLVGTCQKPPAVHFCLDMICFDFGNFIHKVIQLGLCNKFWTVGKILWDIKRNKPCLKCCHFHPGLVCFIVCSLQTILWPKLQFTLHGVLFTYFLLVRNSGYFCLALKELKILKTHENTVSFKKFSDF